MKKLALIALVFVALGASAQQDTLKYRISLKDKAATTYSLDHPEKFLSEKAIARRQRQQLPVDSTDLPVCRRYVDAIRDKGVKIVAMGKWDNFVTVSCNDSAVIGEIAALPFVRATEKVWVAPSKPAAEDKRDSLANSPLKSENYYGPALRQIEISNGVLSCMAMNDPYVMVGTAPEASYWLLRSEDEASEHLVEQDYWAAAVEFADSVGVDVVNTSLGYFTFDDSTKNYKYRDLDGHHALMSRQASKMADKGIVLVCSAGNSGASSWKKITTPGDAENVLTVGAIDRRGVLASFSSIGNTADNRVKPDVVAVGLNSDVMGTNGNLRKASGTSFASPILCGMVTCLWQACPQLTAKEIIELVRQSGDRVDFPDNIYGYGVPDLWKAYQSVSKKK